MGWSLIYWKPMALQLKRFNYAQKNENYLHLGTGE